jgi:hypothetical protein
MCVPLQWFVLQHLTSPALLLADVLLLSLSPLVDALLSLSLAASLADALLLRVSWSSLPANALPYGASYLPTDAWSSVEPWQMLCRHRLFGPLSGRYFATESVLAKFLADGLSPLLLDARSLGGCFATSALSLHRQPLHCCIFFFCRLN